MSLNIQDVMKANTHKKRIVFLTGTRADFGKIKPLIQAVRSSRKFEPHVFVTGMHLSKKYGETVHEVEKCGFPNVCKFRNDAKDNRQDLILANTITGFSRYCKRVQPDMIVVHGDRTEALAGAMVGAFNNVLVAHVEGGEISGTIDEHIRHAVSKMSHIHFVANNEAKRRLVQMGEHKTNIFTIGSPDLDVMTSKTFPSLAAAKRRYQFGFNHYGLAVFHPVTTERSDLPEQANAFADALVASGKNYIVIYPNNDPGSDSILGVYKKKFKSERFKLYPSIRFEYFLTLLKNADFIIGNSSAGIREAPFYGVPSINIGSRQHNRAKRAAIKSIANVGCRLQDMLRAIRQAEQKKFRFRPRMHFGVGNSSSAFLRIIEKDTFWKTNIQKQFLDIDY